MTDHVLEVAGTSSLAGECTGERATQIMQRQVLADTRAFDGHKGAHYGPPAPSNVASNPDS